MKIVQSFWSKPFINGINGQVGHRTSGGWSHPKYYCMSWALSCLLLKKHFGNVELVTDTWGRYFLIDILKLPFESVCVELDAIDRFPADLWAIGKIYTYGLQKRPFLHVDSDVFIWEKFDNSTLSSELISQSIEINFDHDKKSLLEIIKRLDDLPQSIFGDSNTNNLISCNAGIFGGRNFSFFEEYSSVVIKILDLNYEKLNTINFLGLANTIFEQFIFASMAKQKKIPISYLFPYHMDYSIFCAFWNIPHKMKYTHIIGPLKKAIASESWIEERLRLEFPKYYYEIERVFFEHVL